MAIHGSTLQPRCWLRGGLPQQAQPKQAARWRVRSGAHQQPLLARQSSAAEVLGPSLLRMLLLAQEDRPPLNLSGGMASPRPVVQETEPLAVLPARGADREGRALLLPWRVAPVFPTKTVVVAAVAHLPV